MPVTPTRRVPRRRPEFRPASSRQVNTDTALQDQPVATIARSSSLLQGIWDANLNSEFLLTTDQMRRLSMHGIAGACMTTLMHQFGGLKWKIVKDDGTTDDACRWYTLVMHNANDGVGGADRLFSNVAEDILSCRTGAFLEIVRDEAGVPWALYNIDGDTMHPTYNPDWPWEQALGTLPKRTVRFGPMDVAQFRWKPMPHWKLREYNLCPVQMAFPSLLILASGDQYNQRILTEIIPQGILNLGPGFDQRRALAWKEAWDQAKLGGKMKDLGLLYGTDKTEFLKFEPHPKDMAFQETAFWYTSLVCACFELSILDLGMGIQRVSTGAAAEQQTALSRRRGLKAMLRKICFVFEDMILPEGYKLIFDDIDPHDTREQAAVAQMKAQAIQILVAALGVESGIEEARAQALLSSLVTPADAKRIVAQKQQMGSNNAGADITAKDTATTLGDKARAEETPRQSLRE